MAEGQQQPNDAQGAPSSNGGSKRAWWKIKWESLGIGLPGVWLAILYVVLGTFVVLSLSAHQMQYQIYSLNADRERDEQISLWQVLQTHAQWKSLNAEAQSLNKQLGDLTKKKVELSSESSLIAYSFWGAESSCTQEVASLARQLSIINVGCNLDDLASITSKIDMIEDQTRKTALQKQVEELEDQIKKTEQISFKRKAKEAEIFDLNEQLNELNAALDSNYRKLEKLLDKDNLGNKAGDFLNALDYMGDKEALPLVPSFTRMPSDTLKLILVLSMGALGGTISLTRSYLAQKKSLAEDRIGGAYYTFRPFLGAITALSIFILAKAGVLIISTPDQGAGGAELSPYFLSFIGIISGMLADSALDTIQRTGNNWFKNSEVSRDLWAYGLGKALAGDPSAKKEQRDKNLEDNMALLSETLDVSVPTIMKWVDEKQKVPANMQALISAFVRIPPRELFSDIGGDLNVTKMWFAEQWKKNSEST